MLMKIFYLITISLFLIGCSSTYKISDFTSKNKFYDDFNKFADNKSLEIILTDDSSFIADGKTRISDDSLIILKNLNDVDTQDDIFMSLSLTKIKDIMYKNHWTNLPLGFLGGALIGVGIGGAISSYEAHHLSNEDLKNEANLIPLVYGIILGPLVGSIVS